MFPGQILPEADNPKDGNIRQKSLTFPFFPLPEVSNMGKTEPSGVLAQPLWCSLPALPHLLNPGLTKSYRHRFHHCFPMFSLESSLVGFQGITHKANNCFHSSGPPRPPFRACFAHTAAPQRLSQTMENSKIRLWNSCVF